MFVHVRDSFSRPACQDAPRTGDNRYLIKFEHHAGRGGTLDQLVSRGPVGGGLVCPGSISCSISLYVFVFCLGSTCIVTFFIFFRFQVGRKAGCENSPLEGSCAAAPLLSSSCQNLC